MGEPKPMTNELPTIPKSIVLSHTLTTAATDNKGNFKITYKTSYPQYPITVTSTEEEAYESICMTIADAKDLSERLRTMVDAIEAIDAEIGNLDAIITSYTEGDFSSAVPGLLSDLS